jgi:hypothetical protein
MKWIVVVLAFILGLMASPGYGANSVKDESVACTDLDAQTLVTALLAVKLHRTSEMPHGCSVLKAGLTISGPLAIQTRREQHFALIDVPGRGELWTFSDSLKEQTVAKAPAGAPRTGRFKNTLDMDTLGCPTIPLLEKAIDAIGHKRPLPTGCYELNEDLRGLPVIGPLNVVNPTPAKPCGILSSTCWALVEVPGKGSLWTFLSHLKDKHGN